MPSIADLFSEPPTPTNRKMEWFLSQMDDDDRQRVERALRDPANWGHTYVAKMLTAAGYQCTDRVVESWRQRNGVI